MMSIGRSTAAVAVVGLALAAGTGAAVGKSAADLAVLVGVAAGGALLVAGAGAGLLHLLRHRSMGVAVTVVALTAVAAVAVGALAAGNAMFLSSRDLDALWVVVVAAGTVSVAVALALGGRIAAAADALTATARRLGDGQDPAAAAPAPTLREFAELSAQLEASATRLAQARARETALDQSRRELVAWVSHDLRTPLAGIRAMTEALEDGLVEDQETVRRYYRTLRHEADRLGELIDDLFELARIEAGALVLHPRAVSLSDLVSDALAAADPVAAAKGVHLDGRLVGTVPPVPVSPSEVGRVLRNLLHNAIRETPAEGRVEVAVGGDDDAAWVTVSDSCGGIAESDLARVFDAAFRREHARTPSPDAGAGLGLAIAKGLVEAHHGEITVANTGAGCCFRVRLPLTA